MILLSIQVQNIATSTIRRRVINTIQLSQIYSKRQLALTSNHFSLNTRTSESSSSKTDIKQKAEMQRLLSIR
ncbi:unnamed protein product [Cunninghamella echinulata]